MRIKLNDLPEKYKRQALAQISTAGEIAHLEPAVCHAPFPAQKVARFDRPVGISIVEYRHRLCDFGGSAEKYVVDAIVSAGILEDDNRNCVKWIEKEQVQTPNKEQERTELEIWNA